MNDKKLEDRIYLKNILSSSSLIENGYNTDYGNRTFALAYIDGEIYEGDVHKDIVENYLITNELGTESLDYMQGSVTKEEKEDIDLPMAFASYIEGIDNKHYIAIYPETLFDVFLDSVIYHLRKKYPTAIICEDNNDKENSSTMNSYLKMIN